MKTKQTSPLFCLVVPKAPSPGNVFLLFTDSEYSAFGRFIRITVRTKDPCASFFVPRRAENA